MSKIMTLVFILFSNLLLAEGKVKKEIVDSFTDKIKGISIIGDHAEVSFMKHAAYYILKKDHPKYKEILTILELRKNDQKTLQITSSIPKMEIKEIKD